MAANGHTKSIMKLLVVEDEHAAAMFLRKGLQEEGFAVDTATSYHDASEAAAIYDYDAILLDVMIPGGSGFDLCQEWREQGLNTPILFLTARDNIGDKIHGLNSGGDDYLVKPFSFDELLARIRALIRRAAGHPAGTEFCHGDLRINIASHVVTRAGSPISLTATEFRLLQYLTMHVGQLVTRADIREHLWDSSTELDSNIVDVYIRYLRDKLGRNPDLITTRRGEGYIFGTLDQT